MNAPLTSLLWFAAVVVLIPLLLWLLKRSPYGRVLATAEAASMQTVGTLALAQGQRLVTVEVGRGDDRLWLVLGVTAHGIRTLHTMAPQALPAAAPPTAQTAFAQLLQRVRHEGSVRRGDGGAR